MIKSLVCGRNGAELIEDIIGYVFDNKFSLKTRKTDENVQKF